MTLLFASASIVYVVGDDSLGKIIYSVLFILVVVIVLGTNIIVDNKIKDVCMTVKFHIIDKLNNEIETIETDFLYDTMLE